MGEELFGAIVNAGIPALNAKGKLQFEVVNGPTPPKERHGTAFFGCSSGGSNGALFDGPDLRIAIPSREVGAIKKRNKLGHGWGGGFRRGLASGLGPPPPT